ncbi:Nuclear transcription factor Y subunit B-5 [Sesamum alatum]|uniref:Nuclear transcription factor Y subunit B-5 n=1 Tax=Sesamum alatum TaxID=300844 RepID=A0AAE1XUF4_9LAMI|nr:Nuclear transcription factor Y subunit B-5 [Sesamum alatum]
MVDNINIGPKNSSSDKERALINYCCSNNNYAAHHHHVSTTGADQQQEEESAATAGVIKEQDRLLPIANVGRIMKQILPSNAKISKEAKETMQECVSEFISFVTGEASDKCHKEKRKTVNGDDVCWALGNLGFDDYAEPLKRYLIKFREAEGERANQNKPAPAAADENQTDGRQRGASPPPFSFNLMEKRRT